MSEEDEALSLSEMPGVKFKIIKRKLSFDKLLKNKYINYTEEELIQINDSRKDEILELDESNKKLKEELTKTIEKLNSLITSNSEILFQDQKKNITEIENLEKIFYLRKHDHTLSLKYNITFKKQYKALQLKAKNIGDQETITLKIMNDKNTLERLRNENIELTKKIQEQELLSMKQEKELENSNFIQKSENNIQNYANILSNSSLARFKYYDKIENKKKNIMHLKEEFNDLNRFINKNKNKISEEDREAFTNKINAELELLKKDLNKEVEEIIQDCYDNKTSLILEENANNNNDNNNIADANSNIYLNKSSSVSNYNINKNNGIKNIKKINQIKNIERSQSTLFKSTTDNNLKIIKKSIDKNNNSKNFSNFSIFTKFKILKSIKPIKIGCSSTVNSTQNVSAFITKEVIDFNKKSYEEIELEKEIKKINQNDYQQLIDLKGNYADINDRLLNDIKEKKKVSNNRIKQISVCVENNLNKLKQIKEINEIIKKDLDAYEEKIKDKINKMKAKKEEEEKINVQNQNQNEILNKLNNNNDITINDNEINKINDNENEKLIDENKKEIINENQNEKNKEDEMEKQKNKRKRRK